MGAPPANGACRAGRYTADTHPPLLLIFPLRVEISPSQPTLQETWTLYAPELCMHTSSYSPPKFVSG